MRSLKRWSTLHHVTFLSILWLFGVSECRSSTPYQRRVLMVGNSVQLCDPKNPCPMGATCMYNGLTPGLKTCFTGVYNVAKHIGRCPSRIVYGSKLCDFDADCPGLSQKCCGTVYRVCVLAQPIPPQPTVTQIVVGSVQANPPIFDFVGSVGLVQSNGFNVLFDTGGIQEKIQILAGLRDIAGLSPEDIDYVVTSHGHPDHFSNGNLFPDVPNNFNTFRVTGNRYTGNGLFGGNGQREYINNDQNLELIQTNGHTLGDTSLVVRNVIGRGTVILSGDIFQTPTDYADLQSGENVTALIESRQRIACLADYIFPGHGPMFQVTQTIKQNFTCVNT